MLVTLDVSQLSGWLNAHAACRVERRAAVRGAARDAGGRGAVATQAACTERVRLKAWGAQSTRAEHTWNMSLMVVTPEVSQLDTSALKFRKLWKRELMSVMADTHQSAMGPYL